MAGRLFLLRGARSVTALTKQGTSVRPLAAASVKIPPLTAEEKHAMEARFEHDYHGDEDAETAKWKKISLIGVMPAMFLIGFYILVIDAEPHKRPKFKPYDHIRIYRKPVPWRDGKNNLLFNSHVNATRDGYLEGPPKH